MVQAIEYHPEMKEAMKTIIETGINVEHEDDCELADEIDEDEFKRKFLPEKHMRESSLNHDSVKNREIREEEKIENLDKDFPNVEGLIKSVFPRLLPKKIRRLDWL